MELDGSVFAGRTRMPAIKKHGRAGAVSRAGVTQMDECDTDARGGDDMTVREFYEAVPDEHKDDVMCVYDEHRDTVETADIWTTQIPGAQIGRFRSGMTDVVVVY